MKCHSCLQEFIAARSSHRSLSAGTGHQNITHGKAASAKTRRQARRKCVYLLRNVWIAELLSLTNMRHIDVKIAELSGPVEFVDSDGVGDIGHTVSRVPLLKFQEYEARNLSNPPQRS